LAGEAEAHGAEASFVAICFVRRSGLNILLMMRADGQRSMWVSTHPGGRSSLRRHEMSGDVVATLAVARLIHGPERRNGIVARKDQWRS
jgi:hypothetical protein